MNDQHCGQVTYNRLCSTLDTLSSPDIRTTAPGTQLLDIAFESSLPLFSEKIDEDFSFFNENLDEAQRLAVGRALAASHLAMVHGPPGSRALC